MQITDDIFKSYLSCQYKAYLALCGKTGNKTDFEKINDELRKVLEIEVTQQFLKEYNSVERTHKRKNYIYISMIR